MVSVSANDESTVGTASGFSSFSFQALQRFLREAALIKMVRAKKRRFAAAPLWPMPLHKPDPSLESFPVFFLEWKCEI